VAVRRWLYGGLAVIAIVETAGPGLLYHEPAHFWFEDLPAWGSLYGFVACVLIIEASKLVGKLFLMRRENYYDS
jgi:hypothetical protein